MFNAKHNSEPQLFSLHPQSFEIRARCYIRSLLFRKSILRQGAWTMLHSLLEKRFHMNLGECWNYNWECSEGLSAPTEHGEVK